MEVDALHSKYLQSISDLEDIMQRLKDTEVYILCLFLVGHIYRPVLLYGSSGGVLQKRKCADGPRKGHNLWSFRVWGWFPNFSIDLNEAPLLHCKARRSEDDLSSSISSLGISNNEEIPLLKNRGLGEAVVKVRAKYDFMAERSSGELGLTEGEILHLTSKNPLCLSPTTRTDGAANSGWWSGVNSKNETGIFPSAYVELVGSEADLSALLRTGETNSTQTTSPSSSCSLSSSTHLNSSSTGLHVAPISKPFPVSGSAKTTPSSSNGSLHAQKAVDVGAHSGTSPMSSTIPACFVCGCNEFAKNVFKTDSCNNCFHKHKQNKVQ